MRLPGGIRIRIALVLVGIVAGALGTAYLIVVPSLERRLVDARLDQLEKLAVPVAQGLPDDTLLWQERVEAFAVVTTSRVVAFGVLSTSRPALAVVADSRTRTSRDVAEDSVALRALVSGEVERGRVVDANGDYANVAIPLGSEAVLLFQAPLADSLATVRLAERIAGGDFDVPIVDDGNDEIGQLAQAFDRMRVQLAQLDTARKEFVANASHELRTPLFSLGGFLELLTDEDLDDATRRGFLLTMQGQVERLTKLSTDLLDLSRVDAGQLRVVREPVDLGDVVRTLGGDLEHLATSSGHALELEVEGDVWSLGDEERIVQVGRALVVNALVHTPAGTRVVMRARRSGDRAELLVDDDGPGIPPSQREAVFERFYRVEGGVASGSGLGLAIAKELARLMGGAVRLESEPGRTVFTLDLEGEPSPERMPVPAPAFSRENAS